MDNNIGKDIVNVLVHIHNRLAEISKFLEACTAQFTHIDTEEMRDEVKYNATYLDTYEAKRRGFLPEPDIEHSIGFDKAHGLHAQDRSGEICRPLAIDETDSRQLAIDDNGHFIYPSQQEDNNDH